MTQAPSLLLAMFATGCTTLLAGPGPAYDGIIADERRLIAEISVDGGEAPLVLGNSMKIADIEARYCLQRALDDVDRARHNTNWDTAFIVMGGTALAYGAAAQAGAAALPDQTNGKQGIQVSGVTAIAAAAGILALRTALSLSDVARTERVAAARNVDAAMGILLFYALTDGDPKDTPNDGFATCRDADIDVAGTQAGAKFNDAYQRQLATAAQVADNAKKTLATSAAAALDVQTKETNLAEQRLGSEQAIADAIGAAKATTPSAGGLKQDILARADEAQSALDNAKAMGARYDEARAAMATAATTDTVRAAEGVRSTGDNAAKAETTAGAKAKSATDLAAGVAKPAEASLLRSKGADAVKASQKTVAAMKALASAEAAAVAATTEEMIKRAEADYEAKKVELMAASKRYRWAAISLGSADMKAAHYLLTSAYEDLWKSKTALFTARGYSSPSTPPILDELGVRTPQVPPPAPQPSIPGKTP